MGLLAPFKLFQQGAAVICRRRLRSAAPSARHRGRWCTQVVTMLSPSRSFPVGLRPSQPTTRKMQLTIAFLSGSSQHASNTPK
eukprot:9483403-Pyramimonas_sp.AAC.1